MLQARSDRSSQRSTSLHVCRSVSKAEGAELGMANSKTQHKNLAVPTAQGAAWKVLLSPPYSSVLAFIAASHSRLLLPSFCLCVPLPSITYLPPIACCPPVYRSSESAVLTLKLVAHTHQLPPRQKGRNSSISTFAFIPIQGEKLKLETLCKTEVHKFKKKKKRNLFVNTSALCVIWNGIFLHYWNQSWFILVWWPDPKNFVLSQYTIELFLFPQCCIDSDTAVWQPDNPGLTSGAVPVAHTEVSCGTARSPGEL